MKHLHRLWRLFLSCAFLAGFMAGGFEVKSARAVSTLAAGDIILLGLNSDDPDDFAFVTLVDLDAGTQIRFTDSGWRASGSFRPNEGAVKYTAPTVILAGTVISYQGNSSNFVNDNDSGVGTSGFALSTSGDQIIAFQGASGSPTLLYALNVEGSAVWQSDATNSNTSALPTGLVNGTTAMAVTEFDNVKYNGITKGTRAELQAAVGTLGNWQFNDTTRFAFRTCPFTVQSVSGETGPGVVCTTPQNGAIEVAVNANIIVGFDEPVTTTGTWFDIQCTSSGNHAWVTATPGADNTITLDPQIDFNTSEVCTVTIYAAQVSDNDVNDPPDTMAADYVFSFTTAQACGDPAIPIYAVQGPGTASPLLGLPTTVEAIVTGDFQGSSGLNGFFVQEAVPDADPLTSEGLFIYSPGAADVNVGDRVRVRGTVVEYFTHTELNYLTNLLVCSSGNPAPAATVVDLPEAVNGDLERYEGMLVTFPETLTAGQNYFQGRYGQISLGAEGRMFNPTNGNGLGDTLEYNPRRYLVLDDGTSSQNPNPIPYIGLDNTHRAGDTLTGLTGILDYGGISSDPNLRDYRLQPTIPPVFVRANPRTAAPEEVGGRIKVASFNVLNYFNGDGLGGGFPTSRGASSLAEFNRQRDKIIAALVAINADVVGLMEIENDGSGPQSALQDLVNGLNAAMGAGTYALVTEPAPGLDEIKVSMIYKPATVMPFGPAQNYQTYSLAFGDLFNRPPLAQSFIERFRGHRFTVMVNHFKSKSCSDATGLDLDQGDGQGCYNWRRQAQAKHLTRFISRLALFDPDVLVIGDLNSYGEEDPIDKLTFFGMINEVAARVPALVRYTYTFDGQAGYLDHALATPSLDPQISDVTIWHINADEPSVIDYNLEFKPQDLYTPTPYRSSDHDPVIVGLNLGAGAVSLFQDLQFNLAAWVGTILVDWQADPAWQATGFNIYRSASLEGERTLLTPQPILAEAFDATLGFRFADRSYQAGQTYFYWVEVLTEDGVFTMGPLNVPAPPYGLYLPLLSKR